MKKLLLDLRNNGGGLFNPAVKVAEHFVSDGEVIVEVRARSNQYRKTFRSGDAYPDWDIPLVVLVNGGTASAAEILSGAIQDNDLGLVVGTRTWGKGLVQTIYKLSQGAALALTTTRYHTPSGRMIQRDYSSYFDYYAHFIPGREAPQAGKSAQPQEVFRTRLGRRVAGGGGIHPDVEVDSEEIGRFLQLLFARNTFLDFAVRRAASDAAEAISDQELLTGFQDWLVSERFLPHEQIRKAFSEAALRKQVLTYLKSEIALSRSGPEAAHRVLAEADPQIQQALALFDEAAGLLNRRAR